MYVKRFVGSTVSEALALARRELGEESLLLATRFPADKATGTGVEVTVAVERPRPRAAAPRPPAPPPVAVHSAAGRPTASGAQAGLPAGRASLAAASSPLASPSA